MADKPADDRDTYSIAAHEARVAAARAREAAEAFDSLAEMLLSGDYAAASETHLRAVGKLADADEAAAACDDWLTKSAGAS